jgi:hypothetical protein
VTEQSLDGPPHDRLAAQGTVLLGHAAARAFAFAGSNDEGRNGHRAAL